MILMSVMEKAEYLDLDGRQLRLLLTIQSAGSLSAAAKLLDMNQSTVSYWLDLMRQRFDDPLFVRVGNGVEPTERTKAMLPLAKGILHQLEAMCETEQYQPADDNGTLRFAAATIERDSIIKPLLTYARQTAPNLRIELAASGSPFQMVDTLRQATADFILMPDRIDATEGIMRRNLFEFTDTVFFDPSIPLAPGDLDAYCNRPQARVALGPEAGFGIDRKLAALGKSRKIILQTADFDSVLNLISGTDLIATLPSILKGPRTANLSHVPLPWAQDPKHLVLFWHARNQSSARHKFWRDKIVSLAKSAAP